MAALSVRYLWPRSLGLISTLKSRIPAPVPAYLRSSPIPFLLERLLQTLAWAALCQVQAVPDFKYYNWTRVGVITTTEEVHLLLGQQFIREAALHGIQVEQNLVLSLEANVSMAFDALVTAKVRILFLASYQPTALAVWEEMQARLSS